MLKTQIFRMGVASIFTSQCQRPIDMTRNISQSDALSLHEFFTDDESGDDLYLTSMSISSAGTSSNLFNVVHGELAKDQVERDGSCFSFYADEITNRVEVDYEGHFDSVDDFLYENPDELAISATGTLCFSDEKTISEIYFQGTVNIPFASSAQFFKKFLGTKLDPEAYRENEDMAYGLGINTRKLVPNGTEGNLQKAPRKPVNRSQLRRSGTEGDVHADQVRPHEGYTRPITRLGTRTELTYGNLYNYILGEKLHNSEYIAIKRANDDILENGDTTLTLIRDDLRNVQKPRDGAPDAAFESYQRIDNLRSHIEVHNALPENWFKTERAVKEFIEELKLVRTYKPVVKSQSGLLQRMTKRAAQKKAQKKLNEAKETEPERRAALLAKWREQATGDAPSASPVALGKTSSNTNVLDSP